MGRVAVRGVTADPGDRSPEPGAGRGRVVRRASPLPPRGRRGRGRVGAQGETDRFFRAPAGLPPPQICRAGNRARPLPSLLSSSPPPGTGRPLPETGAPPPRPRLPLVHPGAGKGRGASPPQGPGGPGAPVSSLRPTPAPSPARAAAPRPSLRPRPRTTRGRTLQKRLKSRGS